MHYNGGSISLLAFIAGGHIFHFCSSYALFREPRECMAEGSVLAVPSPHQRGGAVRG
jgi:hypothetical protein